MYTLLSCILYFIEKRGRWYRKWESGKYRVFVLSMYMQPGVVKKKSQVKLSAQRAKSSFLLLDEFVEVFRSRIVRWRRMNVHLRLLVH